MATVTCAIQCKWEHSTIAIYGVVPRRLLVHGHVRCMVCADCRVSSKIGCLDMKLTQNAQNCICTEEWCDLNVSVA